jgi:hypothetical protein
MQIYVLICRCFFNERRSFNGRDENAITSFGVHRDVCFCRDGTWFRGGQYPYIEMFIRREVLFFDKTTKDLSNSKTLSIDMTAGGATDDDKDLYRATISDHLIQLAKQFVQPGVIVTWVYSIDRSTFSISYSGFANGEAKGQTINTFESATGSCQVLKK